MAKKCMSCGGSMSKMKKGGTSKSCPPGYHWTATGCQETTSLYKKPLSSTSAKIGIGAAITGAAAMAGTAIKNKIADRKAKKLEAAKA